MAVVYVDFRTAPVDGEDRISEFTWLIENEYELVPHHYFVDYPGAKDLERMVTSVVGGTPMVRYGCQVVLRAFIDSVEDGYIIAFRTREQKELFVALTAEYNLEVKRALCVLDDVTSIDGEVSTVLSSIEEARIDASRKFGNAL
jgi:hypothetical protein